MSFDIGIREEMGLGTWTSDGEREKSAATSPTLTEQRNFYIQGASSTNQVYCLIPLFPLAERLTDSSQNMGFF